MKLRKALSQKKSKSREIVVKILYEMDIGSLSLEEARERITRKCKAVRGFALSLFDATVSNVNAIDKVIRDVAANWDLERMAAFDRNLLRVAVAELLFTDGTPHKVVINEAIEMAKRFSTENSGKFVNAVLDKIARMKGALRDNL